MSEALRQVGKLPVSLLFVVVLQAGMTAALMLFVHAENRNRERSMAPLLSTCLRIVERQP
jgi:hypothetical protein